MNIIEKLGITPGPWEVEETEKVDTGLSLLLRQEESIYCKKSIGWIYEDKYQDAKLIASAPEMLECLIIMVLNHGTAHYFTNGKGNEIPVEKFLQKEVSIIEKATGKSWEEIKELL